MRTLVVSSLVTLGAALLASGGLAAPLTAASVSGSLTSGDNAGSSVSASCQVNGARFTGSGSISGRNPQTGRSYSYPFNITNGYTTSAGLTLKGQFANTLNNAPVTLTCQSPSGTLTFVYQLRNGGQASGRGSGRVTTR